MNQQSLLARLSRSYLRAGVKIHVQILVHDSEATDKLEAGITVMTTDTELPLN